MRGVCPCRLAEPCVDRLLGAALSSRAWFWLQAWRSFSQSCFLERPENLCSVSRIQDTGNQHTFPPPNFVTITDLSGTLCSQGQA